MFWTWWIRITIVDLLLWIALTLPVSRRVIVAWWAYLTMRLYVRHHPRLYKPSMRRWLWIVTLRKANGITDHHDRHGRRIHAR